MKSRRFRSTKLLVKHKIWYVPKALNLELFRLFFIYIVCAQHGHLVSKIPNYSRGWKACAEAFAEFLQYLLCAGVPDKNQDRLTPEALASRPVFHRGDLSWEDLALRKYLGDIFSEEPGCRVGEALKSQDILIARLPKSWFQPTETVPLWGKLNTEAIKSNKVPHNTEVHNFFKKSKMLTAPMKNTWG